MTEETADSAIHAIVSGRVQGVSFRYFTQQIANRNKIVGWVRNLPDGTVELWAEGPRSALERLIQALHYGPPHAEVTEVAVTWLEPEGDHTAFRIRL